MRYLLQQLGKSVAEIKSQVNDAPEQRLLAIVRGNFTAPQTDKAAMKVWLAFGPAVCISPIYIVYSK